MKSLFALAALSFSFSSFALEGIDYHAFAMLQYTTRDRSPQEAEQIRHSLSPEFDFLKRAFSAAAEASPALRTHFSSIESIENFYEDPYRFLASGFYDVDSSDAQEKFAAREIVARVNKLIKGCPSSVVDKTGTAQFFLNNKCHSKNTKLISKLNQIGINTLVQKKDEDGVIFYLGTSSTVLRDMSFVQEKLSRIKETSEIASEFSEGYAPLSVTEAFNGFLGGLGGATNVLEFQNMKTSDDSTVIQFRYWLGEGDCLSGCGKIRTWDVTATLKDGKVSANVAASVRGE